MGLHSRKSNGNPKMSKMETNGVTHHNTKGYLQPGDRAPEFKGQAAVLKNGDVTDMDIKLSDYLGKYVVFFFYPKDFTFVCPTEIIAFSERVEEFKKINCEVIGCSTDSYNCHRAWMKPPERMGVWEIFISHFWLIHLMSFPRLTMS